MVNSGIGGETAEHTANHHLNQCWDMHYPAARLYTVLQLTDAQSTRCAWQALLLSGVFSLMHALLVSGQASSKLRT